MTYSNLVPTTNHLHSLDDPDADPFEQENDAMPPLSISHQQTALLIPPGLLRERDGQVWRKVLQSTSV